MVDIIMVGMTAVAEVVMVATTVIMVIVDVIYVVAYESWEHSND